MKSSPKLTALVAVAVSLIAVHTAIAQDAPIDSITPVTDEMLLNPPDADWLMWRRTFNGWGYSPLDQISKENVGDLQRSEENTSELQSLMRISYAVFCLKKKRQQTTKHH